MKQLNIPTRSLKRRRLNSFEYGVDGIHDEAVTDYNYSARCYNFSFTSGALKGGYGLQTHQSIPTRAHRVWVYRHFDETTSAYKEQVLYLGDSNVPYIFENGKSTLLAGTLHINPVALNYRLNSKDVLIISCENSPLRIWNGTSYAVAPDSPKIKSMALHYERLFVTSPVYTNRVYFSRDLDPTDWNEDLDAGGFIELLDERGALNKVISFRDYVYIFRDKGISRVSAFGDQTEFEVRNLFVTSGVIYSQSVAMCGGSVFFLASDGLYRFDGSDCTRVLDRVSRLISKNSTGAVGEYHDGKYFLSCRIDFNDGKTVGCESEPDYLNNALICLDISSGEYSLQRGMDIRYLKSETISGESLLIACEANGSCGIIAFCGERFGVPLEKHWRIPVGDFGSCDRTKLLTDVYIKTNAAITLTAITENKSKTVEVNPSPVPRRVRFNISGRLLGLEIDCLESDCNISRPTLIYAEL